MYLTFFFFKSVVVSFPLFLQSFVHFTFRFEEAKQEGGESQPDKPTRRTASKASTSRASSSEETFFIADEETTQADPAGRTRRFKLPAAGKSSSSTRGSNGRSLNIEGDDDIGWAEDSGIDTDEVTEEAASSSSSSREGYGRSTSGFGGSRRRQVSSGISLRQPVALQQTSSSSGRSSFSQRSKVRESLRESLDSNKRSDGPKVSLPPPKGLSSFTPRDRQSSIGGGGSGNRGFTPAGADSDEIRPTASKKNSGSPAATSSSPIAFGKKSKIEFKKFDRFERPDIRKNLLNKFLKNRPVGNETSEASSTTGSGSAATTTAEEEVGSSEEGGDEALEFPDDHESSPSALVPSIINDEELLQHLGEHHHHHHHHHHYHYHHHHHYDLVKIIPEI